MKLLISGGGTGGHIFPAIAIADAVKALRPDTEVLFVGAEGKMEMERVPKAGYPIEGLPVVGFQRRFTLKNLMFPFKLLNSLLKARRILNRFRPDVCVGVGGYASGPILEIATRKGIPSLVQEQNSYAGVTNRILGGKVQKICVAYENAKRFFPAEKIVHTGNPVRKDLVEMAQTPSKLEALRAEAYSHYGLNPNRKTLLVLGGSLGARTLNESLRGGINKLSQAEVQVIWQCGKLYFEEYSALAEGFSNVKIMAFVERMDLAYAVSDLVVSRAGALSISELCLLGKATIFVPSPNVSEDHQTANAMALVERGAGLLVKDAEAQEHLVDEALNLLADAPKRQSLSENCRAMGIANSAEMIAKEVISLSKK